MPDKKMISAFAVFLLFSSGLCAEVETVLRVYTVKKGDTLHKIASNFYNDGGKWKNIWEYNKYVYSYLCFRRA